MPRAKIRLHAIQFILAPALWFFMSAPVIEARGNDIVGDQLLKLARDLDAGSLPKLEIVWLRTSVATIVGVNPQLFDKMVDDQITLPMVMSRCEFPISGAIDSSLSRVFRQAAETAAKSQPREVYWRLRFYDVRNSVSYTLYMGRTYTNTPDVGLIIDTDVSTVDRILEEWFETHVDLKDCVIRP
jgi:hypothetical protein